MLTRSKKEKEEDGTTMKRGSTIESISGPKCLPEQTGSLAASFKEMRSCWPRAVSNEKRRGG